MKIKKRTKASKMHGKGMGTHGWGARKKHKKTGHRGGKGMSGSGKRADHKKTLMTKLYGHKYFGKQGITSRGTKRDTLKKINLKDIEFNIGTYLKKGLAKKISGGFEVNLKNHKILGTGEVKEKLVIKAKSASKSAREKVEARGGEIILIHSSKRGQMKEKSASKSAIEKVKRSGGQIVLVTSSPNKEERKQNQSNQS